MLFDLRCGQREAVKRALKKIGGARSQLESLQAGEACHMLFLVFPQLSIFGNYFLVSLTITTISRITTTRPIPPPIHIPPPHHPSIIPESVLFILILLSLFRHTRTIGKSQR